MTVGVLATVHLPYTTGLPEDESVNTFAFVWDGTGDEPTTEITTALTDFYNVSGGTAVRALISEVVDRGTDKCHVDLAPIIDAGPVPNIGGVYFQDHFTLGAPHGTGTPVSLPLECAIVCSFYASIPTLTSIRRRRGRIYLGPLDIVALDTTGPFPMIPSSTTDSLADACQSLQEDAAVAGFPWAVWSRAAGDLFPVDSGWVNNEFDTQRRRGAEATARSNWTVLI